MDWTMQYPRRDKLADQFSIRLIIVLQSMTAEEYAYKKSSSAHLPDPGQKTWQSRPRRGSPSRSICTPTWYTDSELDRPHPKSPE